MLHILKQGERREIQDLGGKLPLCASKHCTPPAGSPGQHRGLGPSPSLSSQTPRLGLEAVHTLSQHLVVVAGKVSKMNKERFCFWELACYIQCFLLLGSVISFIGLSKRKILNFHWYHFRVIRKIEEWGFCDLVLGPPVFPQLKNTNAECKCLKTITGRTLPVLLQCARLGARPWWEAWRDAELGGKPLLKCWLLSLGARRLNPGPALLHTVRWCVWCRQGLKPGLETSSWER